jgi:hypothetical protein
VLWSAHGSQSKVSGHPRHTPFVLPIPLGPSFGLAYRSSARSCVRALCTQRSVCGWHTFLTPGTEAPDSASPKQVYPWGPLIHPELGETVKLSPILIGHRAPEGVRRRLGFEFCVGFCAPEGQQPTLDTDPGPPRTTLGPEPYQDLMLVWWLLSRLLNFGRLSHTLIIMFESLSKQAHIGPESFSIVVHWFVGIVPGVLGLIWLCLGPNSVRILSFPAGSLNCLGPFDSAA